MTDELTVDDLVSGRTAEQLGEGLIPTNAVLLVATIDENGPGFRYVVSEGTPQLLVLGMLRSATIKIEHDDLDSWADEDDDA